MAETSSRTELNGGQPSGLTSWVERGGKGEREKEREGEGGPSEFLIYPRNIRNVDVVTFCLLLSVSSGFFDKGQVWVALGFKCSSEVFPYVRVHF